MKKFSKILSVALLVALVLSLGVTSAFADLATSQTIADDSAPDSNGKYTISVAADDTHTYTVYQILTGTLIPGEEALGNPVWGADAKTDEGTNTGVDAFITAITATGLSNTAINDLVEAQLATDAEGRGTVKAGTSMDVVPGYYLIVDTTPAAELGEGDAYSLNIVAVFNDITITPKKGTTTSEKHVDDVNDSTGTEDATTWQDSADYDIGDSIPYCLTFTLPADYANYESYKVVFTDDMSKGLTYNGDAQIFFGTNDDEGDDIEFVAGGTSYYTDGTVYTYTITDLKDPDLGLSLSAGDVITITYSATLNKDAVIGRPGNPNRYQVEYSNNPNKGGEGKTPWDVNIIFTYTTTFNKVDENEEPLTGADFELDKFILNSSGKDTIKVSDEVTLTGTWTKVTELGSGNNHPTKSGSTAGTTFSFSGIDDGWYRLRETVTPQGYNTIDPIVFQITATHTQDSDKNNPLQLTDLVGADGGTFTMTKNVPAGELLKDIQNNHGTVLPSTGGIGTTIFYAVGGILVLAAIVLLITKKRMSD